jgi:membrane-bound lytic murein transglycosylase F
MMRVFLIINALISLFLAGCSDTAPQPLKEDGELVILTRVGATTYSLDGEEGASGFDHDLTRMFAQELGRKSRYVIATSDNDLLQRLRNNEAHLAAAWQIAVDDPDIRTSEPYYKSHNILVTHEASLPVSSIKQLARKTVHVVSGSRQEAALRETKKSVPELIIKANHSQNELDLMEGVANHRFDATVVNNAVFDIGNNFYPELRDSLAIGPEKPIVWLFPPGTPPELITQANEFLQRIQQNGEMERLKDRYFGHVERLTQEDCLRLIERMRTVLPQYRAGFQAAQIETGIDWRLLAALAYQESQWEPLATSSTGVRGMMMLTEDTADSLGVSNRLDPVQSIAAGAKYLSELRDALPPSIRKSDRIWMALAAYNVGMGHLNAARYLAKTLKTDPNSWYTMKKVLPLLAKPQYYSRLKSGKGRGGEAVIMAENIRIYTDIINRYERPYTPLERTLKTKTGSTKLPVAIHKKPVKRSSQARQGKAAAHQVR